LRFRKTRSSLRPMMKSPSQVLEPRRPSRLGISAWVPAPEKTNVQDGYRLAVGLDLEANCQRRYKRDSPTPWARLALANRIGPQPLVDRLAGRRDGLPLTLIRSNPQRRQVIESDSEPLDAEHQSFSRCARTCAVV
jgi:hypothetical protein